MLTEKRQVYSAGAFAEKLASRQIARTDKKQEPVPDSEATCCLIGITMTVAPRIVAGVPTTSDDPTLCRMVWERLRTVPKTSMDAFYCFYSPALGETLSLAQGE